MITEGTLTIELLNKGTKSEDFYALLAVSEERSWILYRPEVNPAGDQFFVPFADHYVSVEGEQEMDKYIRVENITITDTDETKEEPENEQNDMP